MKKYITGNSFDENMYNKKLCYTNELKSLSTVDVTIFKIKDSSIINMQVTPDT